MECVNGGEPTPEVSPNVAFEIVATRTRRAVLSYLRDSEDGVASFDEIVAHVMRTVGDQQDSEREDVVASLYHTDIPKLADAGLINYDERSEPLRYRGHPLVEACLDLAQERE